MTPVLGFVGALDAVGRGRATLALPGGVVPPQALGATLSFTSVVLDPSGTLTGSAATEVRIVP